MDKSNNQITPLFASSCKCHLDIVIRLLNMPNIDPNKAVDGVTPLIGAILNEQTDVVSQLLLPSRIDVDIKTHGYLYVCDNGKGYARFDSA